MTISKLTASTLLAVIFLPAIAGAEWYKADENSNASVYYKVDEVTTTASGNRLIWTRIVYTKPINNIKELVFLQEINCTRKVHRILQNTGLSETGDALATDNIPTEWERIIPDSTGETVFPVSCRNDKPAKHRHAPTKKLSQV